MKSIKSKHEYSNSRIFTSIQEDTISYSITSETTKKTTFSSGFIPTVPFTFDLKNFQEIVDFMKSWGKSPIIAKDVPGFIVNRIARPFYGELVEFMSSGPIVAAVLEKDNAVEDFRKLIGATNPADAAPGTIRARFAKNVGENAVHGSDSDENAAIETAFHFAGTEIFG